jgi:hypothetical protein
MALFALLAMMISSLGLVACGGGEPAPEAEMAGEEPAVTDKMTYTVRGEVTQLPEPGAEGSDLMVRHEPIPDFKNAKGEVVGMNAMTMPFPVSNDVSLDGIAVGDKVRLTFEVQFQPATSFVTTEIDRLPPDTELDFGGEAHAHEGHDHGDHEGHDHDM